MPASHREVTETPPSANRPAYDKPSSRNRSTPPTSTNPLGGRVPVPRAPRPALAPAGEAGAGAVALIQPAHNPSAAVKNPTRTRRLAGRLIHAQQDRTSPPLNSDVLDAVQHRQVRRLRSGRDSRTQQLAPLNRRPLVKLSPPQRLGCFQNCLEGPRRRRAPYGILS